MNKMSNILKLINSKYFLFLSALLLVSVSQNTYSIGLPPALTGEINTSENNTPKLLSDFGEGCYGLDQTDLTPILHKERTSIVGFFYLVANPNYSEGSVLSKYNIVLCEKRKIDEPKYLSFSAFFPQSQESLDKNESYDEYFQKSVRVSIKNSFNGNFSVKTTPNFIILFKSPSLLFKSTDESFALSNISFALRDDVAVSVSTSSVILNLQEDIRPKQPIFENKAPAVQKQKCQIIGVPGSEVMFCHKEIELRSPVKNQLIYNFEARSLAINPKKVIITANALTNPGTGDPDEICYGTNGNLNAPLEKYLDFDVETGILSQKLDSVMPEGTKCIVNVTANDTSEFISAIDTSVIYTENNVLSDVRISSSKTQRVIVTAFVPSVATVGVRSSVEVRSSGGFRSSGGGSHVDTVNKLRKIGNSDVAKPEETILKCPEETYIRYPDQRGFGVSLDLFKDASSNNRAYDSLIDLAEQRIVNGDNMSGDARLDSVVSRAEFVKIVTIAREDTLLLGDCLKLSNFSDVAFDDWFTPFVQNLEARSIVRGYDGNVYKPAQAINLVEAYKVLALSFHYITIENAEKIAHDRGVEWYVPYVEVLEKSGLVPSWLIGMDKEAILTRGDIFIILSNILLQKDWLKNLNW